MRVGCQVPGCRRTRGDHKNSPVTPTMEWICLDHWRLIPALRRRAYARVKRLAKVDPGRVLYALRAHRLWETLKREAICRAAGI